MDLLLRLFAFARGFAVGASNFGLLGAFRVFVLHRRRQTRCPISIRLRSLNRRFWFRGAADRGVVSHFHKEGYRIRDDGGEPVRTIVDAGANIGDETLRFRCFHPQARIVALEPDAANFALLERNVSGDPAIIALRAGLWSHRCRLRVVPGQGNENFTVVEVEDPTEPADVEAISIAELMHRHGLSGIDILKLDIEGAERQVFRAPDTSWLRSVKVLIFECPDQDAPGATQEIFHALIREGLRFRCSVLGENLVLIRADVDWKVESELRLRR